MLQGLVVFGSRSANASQIVGGIESNEKLVSVNASPKVQTPPGIRCLTSSAAAVATPISGANTISYSGPSSVLPTNSLASPLSAVSINNSSISQGQPIIITTSAPVLSLVSTTMVSF